MFQIGDEGGAALVGFFGLFADGAWQIAVLVPAGVIELDEAHAALGHAAG